MDAPESTADRPGFRKDAAVVRQALELMGVAPREFVPPAFLGVASTLLRLVTLALFLPLVRGLLAGDFGRLDRFLPISSWIDTESDLSMFGILGAAVVLAALARGACSYAGSQSLARRSEAAQARLGERILHSHLRFGQQHYDLTRFGANVRQIQRLPARSTRVLGFLHKTLTSSVALGLYLAAMAWLSPGLTLGAILVLGGYVFVFKRLVDRVDDLTEKVDEVEDRAASSVHDLLLNLPLVKLARAEEAEVQAFADVNAEGARTRLEERRLEGLVDPLRDFLSIVLLLLFLGVCALFIRGVEATAISRYLVFFLVFRRAMGNFSQIQKAPTDWKNIVAQIRGLLGVLDEEGKFVVPGGQLPFAGLREGIEVRGLDFTYQRKRRRALKGVHLSIPRGRRTMIVGATGSGKSTLFRLLLRLYDCPPATIFVDGVDIREIRTDALLARVSFAGPDPLFFNDTIRRNASYGIEGVDEASLREAAQRAEALGFIEALENGFDERIGDRGTLLSSGEKQRLALIRVFLSKADLILLDEATSALDSVTEARVLAALEAFAAGRTLVVIAHRLSNLRPDDRVVVFDERRVVEQGRRDELLAAGGTLARLWEAQQLPADPGAA